MKKKVKSFVALILSVMFFLQQACVLPVLASTITGITNGGSGTFNINPQVTNSGTGFRHYNRFELSQGDIANLIYSGGISRFVNLVDNNILINGILNTMRDGNFYNGTAVFVSPRGLTVGASGVLNVGALTAITPNLQDYVKYTAISMGNSYGTAAASALGINVIDIPGYTEGITFELLKNADTNKDGKIDIKGKIIARGDVELIGKEINIGNTSLNKAGIVAGVGTGQVTNANEAVDTKIATVEQAGKLFNALVSNNVKSGKGFARDGKGNIIIKAQSFKTAEVVVPTDKLKVAGTEYAIDSLFDVSDNYRIKDTLPSGLSAIDVENALNDALSIYAPSDAFDPDSINNTNYAIVNIENANLYGNNLDISATSKTDYIAQKGNPLYSRLDSSALSQMIQKAIAGEKFDYEGSRAKAVVNVEDGANLVAKNDVNLKSLAVANTTMTIKSMFAPTTDTTSEIYYTLGTKTISDVNVYSGAVITADNDVNINAASQNSQWIKIKNPTSVLGEIAGSKKIPNFQITFLKSQLEADTNANVFNGAIINAKNLNVSAVNASNDLSVVNTIATVGDNMGVAIAVSIKDADINTNAFLDTNVNTNSHGNVSVIAQNMHTESSTVQASVEEGFGLKTKVVSGIISKITDLLSKHISKIADLGSITDSLTGLPNVSTGLIVNNTNINTVAKVGKHAKIHADNVDISANAVDLTVNIAKASLKKEKNADGTNKNTGYMPSPGVAVIVNNQNNNTQALVEDGDGSNYARIIANDKFNVNATLEQPMNDSTFKLALNLLQTATDVGDMFSEEASNLSKFFSLDSEDDWDIRSLMQDVTNPTAEVGFDISNVMLDLKSSGLTSSLGLQGFFNNWAESVSNMGSGGVGVAASIVDTNIKNNTIARIGNNANITAGDITVNSANKVVQMNAAGDVAKLWKIADGASGSKGGVGGTIMLESVESTAKAQIGDNAVIVANGDLSQNKGNVNINAVNSQDFLTAVVTGSKATSSGGVAISGSVVVQDIFGDTIAQVGKSKIQANNLNVVSGKGQINLAKKSLGQLIDKPFKDLNSSLFETGFDADLSSPQINAFSGIDEDTGLLMLKDTKKDLKDGISNIILTGALAQQKATTSASSGSGSGSTSSSGAAVGASVTVSEFARNVGAFIDDGADITLKNNLNVEADSKTQSLNIALAGAFAGGVSVKKPGIIDNITGKLKNKAEGYKDKLVGLFSKTTGLLASSDTQTTDSTPNQGLDDHGRPKITVDGKEYKTDINGQYYNSDGEVLKDSKGNSVKYQGSLGESASTLNNAAQSSSNLSAALAGAVNAQVNKSTVKAQVGKANIKVGKDVSVKANQTTKALNISTGVAKASTVGAGAGVNFVQNSNETSAIVKGSNITFTNENANHNMNVLAEENNDNVQVAIGVGVTSTSSSSSDGNTQLSAGGSFNTDILENSVIASIEDGSVIKNENDSLNNISVDVDAENHSGSYKGAGGLSVSVPSGSSTSVGAGVGGNLNIIKKTTKAQIDNSQIKNAKNVKIVANRDNTKATEDIISVEVGGSVVSGGQGAYTFSGAMGTDVIKNNVTSQISNGSVIDTNGDVDVVANNVLKNANIAGAVNFSSATNGVGVGVGAILNIIRNNVAAYISDAQILNSNNINVEAKNNEDLKFLAVNMGVQTGNGIPINANGIVNYVKSNIEAGLINSQILNNKSNINVISNYDTDLKGITLGGAVAAGSGLAFSANVLSNTLFSDNTAKVEGTKINKNAASASGDLKVKATSDEKIDVVPLAFAVTSSGSAAASANVGVNVVKNNTRAYIDKSQTTNELSEIKANNIEVVAKDDTTSRSRGGVLAASGGTAGVGGAILTDVYLKNVESYIDNSVISQAGDITVDASAKNIFGYEDPGSITASSLASDITDGNYDASHDARFDRWEMIYNVAGGSTAGVSGSLMSKNVINKIKSRIGGNTRIEKAKDIKVSALNKVSQAQIAGNVSAGGTAGVGVSVLSNVNVSSVEAGIEKGAKIGSQNQRVGEVTVDAQSIQDYHSILFAVAGGGTAAVNGSVNSNIVVNDTNAYIDKGVDIYSYDKLNVLASDTMDIESLNLAVAGSGTAAGGAILYVDLLNNKVNSTIGRNNDADITKSGILDIQKDVLVKAGSNEDFQANILMVGGSGTAAVGGIVIANTMASEVKAGIEETTLKSGSKVDVKASNGFNEKNKNKTTGLKGLVLNADGTAKVDSLDVDDFIPLVSILNVAGSGVASVTGSIINNVVTTNVESYVKNADITTANGLNLDAQSTMTTYDTAMGIAASGTAAVGVTGINNVYAGKTTSIIEDSTISGNVDLNSKDTFNLNTILFTATGTGTGASITAIENTNTIVNKVKSLIKNTKITNANKVNVNSENNLSIQDVVLAGSGTGVGAAVNAVPITNVFISDNSASIIGGSIDGASVSVNAKDNIETVSFLLGIAGSGMGGSVAGYVLTNVFDNDLNAYIDGVKITNGVLTSTNAASNIDMFGGIMSTGFTGVGADVMANGIVSVINSNINSYIVNSDITNGNVSTNATQTTDITDTTASANAAGVGDASAVNSIVHVFKNKLNSFVKDTKITNANDINISAKTTQDIQSDNTGFSAGAAAASANALVNVLENETNAYLDAGNQDVTSNGKIAINAQNDVSMRNITAMISGGGLGASANVNANIINNNVKAQLLSENGKITANEVEVKAQNSIGLDSYTTSAAAGGFGLAGTVAITSLGDRFDASDKESKMKTGESLDSVKTSTDKLTNISYEKNGETKDISNSVGLKKDSTSKKEGTVANINAKLTTKNSNGVKVIAKNTLKGYNSDTSNITNANLTGGMSSTGASVLVTDMKYNTTAKISGGSVEALNGGKVQVEASNTVKSKTNAVAATIGANAIGGNVAYFNNEANTTAKIENAKVQTTGNVDVKASSLDNIEATSISGSVGTSVATNLAIAIAQTKNNVNALITGSNIDIDAGSLNVIGTNTSTLNSKMYGATIGGVGVIVALNKADSNATANALIDATNGTIDLTNDLNIIAQTNGIDVTNNVVMGSAGFLTVNSTNQFANANASFNAGVKGTDINANNINIKSGVKENSDEAGSINATVKAVNAGLSYYNGSATVLSAKAKGDANVVVTGGKINAGNKINLISKLKRVAKSSSTGAQVSAANVGGLYIKTETQGNNLINTQGGNITAKDVDVLINATNKASADSIGANLSFLSGQASVIEATTNSNTNINLGNITANNGTINVKTDVKQEADSGSSSISGSLAKVSSTSIKTKASGTNNITTSGLLKAKNLNIAINDKADATTKMQKGSVSLANADASILSAEANTTSNIKSGNINADNVDIKLKTVKNAKIKNQSGSASLANLKATTMKTKVAGKSGVTIAGTIKNFLGNGKGNKISIKTTDTSTAQNEAVSNSVGFANGGYLNISSIAESYINNNIGGDLNAKDITIYSDLTRTAITNASTSSAGLFGIGYMNLLSEITNGSNTIFNGKMNSDNLIINSKMNNTVESYVKDFSAGLVALAHGSVTNRVNSSVNNIVTFNGGTDIDTGKINTLVDTLSNAYLFKESGNYGIYVIKGGNLTNELKGSSQLTFNNANIHSKDNAEFNVANNAKTPNEMQVKDDAGGFIVKAGAKLKNTLTQGAKINVLGNTKIISDKDLNLNIESGTQGFKQYVRSDGGGFTAHNKASSKVSATINNEINLNGGLLQGKNVNINMNSSNDLSSRAYVEAHHFAGQPSVESRVDLTVNNRLNVKNGATIKAFDLNPDGTAVNINFMNDSVQNINQHAEVYVEAAVASADYGGGINFQTNNNVNIESGGLISSSKDVNVNFNKGRENLSSLIKYKKVSRAAFGIPITKRGSWSSVRSGASNNVKVDGQIIAGDGNQMKLTILKDGTVTSDSTIYEGTHYTKEEAGTIGKADPGSNKALEEEQRLQNEIDALNEKLARLNSDKTATENEKTQLENQINDLKLQLAIYEYINGLQGDKKISEAQFSNILLQILNENKVKFSSSEAANQTILSLMQYYTSTGSDTLYALDPNGNVILKLKYDSNDQIMKDSKGNVLFDGYEFVYDASGNIKENGAGNKIVRNSSGKEIDVYGLTVDMYIKNLSYELDKTNIKSQLSGLNQSSTIEDIKTVLANNKVTVSNALITDIMACYSSSGVDTVQLDSVISTMTVDKAQAQADIKASLNDIRNNISFETKSINGTEMQFVTYQGDVIYSPDLTSSLSALLDDTKMSLNNTNATLADLANSINDLTINIEDYQSQLDYVKVNGIDGVYSNGGFYFKDLNASGGSININAQKGKSNVYGTGEMVISLADIWIDNFSNSDLIFSNINIGSGNSGVIVDGKSYGGTYEGIKRFESNLRVRTKGTQDNLGAITINNRYDHNHPVNNTQTGVIPSNILVNGNIRTNCGDVNIYNESGDVTINDTIVADKITINMPQGNFTQNTKGKNYKLKKDDNIFAGKGININAGRIEIEGNMQAGIATKQITITEDMLKPENLLVDKETGLRNLIDLTGEGKKSPYMNDGNNIKAIYNAATNTVELFGTQIARNDASKGQDVNNSSGIRLNTTKGDLKYGNITLKKALDIKNTSTLKHADGYGTIKIENNTNSNLVVNGLENNRMYGQVKHNGTVLETGTNPNVLGTIINMVSPSVANADINLVTSGTGDLSVRGLVSSGNVNDGSFKLHFETNGNLNILNRTVSSTDLTQVETIDTNGTIEMNKKGTNGGININGKIKNKNGNVLVSNEGDDLLLIDEKGYIDINAGDAKLVNNGNAGIEIKGVIRGRGNKTIEIDNQNTNASSIKISQGGLVNNLAGNIDIKNKGTNGVLVEGNVEGELGDININSEKGLIDIASSGVVKINENNKTSNKNIIINNTQDASGINIAGTIYNYGVGKTLITNNGETDGLAVSGNIISDKGIIDIVNNKGAFDISGNVTNKSTNASNNTLLTNNADSILNISGNVLTKNGNTLITNTNEGTSSGIDIIGLVKNQNGNTTISNNGQQGTKVSGTVSNNNGNLDINNTSNKILISGTVENNQGRNNIINTGENGIEISGNVLNKKGVTNIENNNTSESSKILLTVDGKITNNNGDILINNKGTNSEAGIDIDGLIKAENQNIIITNENSDIVIGEYASSNDNYITASNGNVQINQTNGNILNGIIDTDTVNKNQNHDLGNRDQAYKTLIKAGKDFIAKVTNGNIGKDTHNISGKETGFGVNASTRDYTESINVNVNGKVNLKAQNSNNALINVRAKDANLNIDSIVSDGNVMLTVADWKQADLASPDVNNEPYYHGYSVINAASDMSKPNIQGRNISVISSDNIGTSSRVLTYNQLEGGSVSFEAENDLYIRGLGKSDNIWQLITKRGNMNLDFAGNTVIRELTVGKDLKIVNRGKNLTIYDLGLTSNFADKNDDILYPHDKIELSSVSPETVHIEVLDVTPSSGTILGDSTLNIYNAYVKGSKDPNKKDVTLIADNIIAHAYDAASSNVSNAKRPNGFDAKNGRTYANDIFDPNAAKTNKAKGFNTVGNGDKLSFDIHGVTPDNVAAVGAHTNIRNYNPQEVIETYEIFGNPLGFKNIVYKAKDVTLSLNSSTQHLVNENRGMLLKHFYSDNAYVDTKDLNLKINDAFITNYGEFRNGDRFSYGGGRAIDPGVYRWLAIVDNDYYRNISDIYNIPVTSQMYTRLTGSFALSMGNLIVLESMAPVVVYNPYEVVNLPRTENSFYRLTYKEDKIQKTTATDEFRDIDKSTYKPTKRNHIRFTVKEINKDNNLVLVSSKQSDKIKSIIDISKGGLAIEHNGDLKLGDQFIVNLEYNDIKVSPKVEVVRVENNKAGLKFIDLDDSDKNKILFMNLMTSIQNDISARDIHGENIVKK